MTGARQFNLMETTMNLDKYTYPKTSIDLQQAVQAPALDEARSTLQQANSVAFRILQLADRLLGPVPSEGSSGGPSAPPPMGELERFRAEMRDTRQAMIFADDALTRIEQELIG